MDNPDLEKTIKHLETMRKLKGLNLPVERKFYRLIKSENEKIIKVNKNLRESSVVYDGIVQPAHIYLNENSKGNIQLVEMKIEQVDGVSERFVQYVLDFWSRPDRLFGGYRRYSEKKSKAYVDKRISALYDHIEELMIYGIVDEKIINFPRTEEKCLTL